MSRKARTQIIKQKQVRYSASPAKHVDVLRQEVTNENPDYPLPLKYDAKPIYRNYLPAHTSRQKSNQNLNEKPQKILNTQPRYQPPPYKSKSKQTVVNVLSSDDSDESDCAEWESGSDCQCKPRFPMKPINIEQNRRRTRQFQAVPYYEQSIQQIDRIRRINFADSSETSSSEEDDRRNEIVTRRQPYEEQRVRLEQPQQRVQREYVEQPAHIPQPPPPKKMPVRVQQEAPPPQQRPKIVRPVNAPPVNRPTYKQPVRKRYETPPVVHPQPLRKPAERHIPPEPTKPLYRKQVERKRKVIPRQPPQPPQLPPPARKTLRGFDPTRKDKLPTAKRLDSSCSDCACECLSDSCSCGSDCC